MTRTIIKGTTKRGQDLVRRNCRLEGETLGDVYNSWSEAKEAAYARCWEQYMLTEGHKSFGITSHNTFQFTCSWLGFHVDENTGECIPAMFIETANNSYTVLLEDWQVEV